MSAYAYTRRRGREMYHIYIEYYNTEHMVLEIQTDMEFYSTLDRLLDSDYRVLQIKKIVV